MLLPKTRPAPATGGIDPGQMYLRSWAPGGTCIVGLGRKSRARAERPPLPRPLDGGRARPELVAVAAARLELRRLRPVEVLLVAAEVGPRRPRPHDFHLWLDELRVPREVEVRRAVAPVPDVRRVQDALRLLPL